MLYILYRVEITSATINVSYHSPSATLHTVLGGKWKITQSALKNGIAVMSWLRAFVAQGI